jgi:ribosomal protein S18 acetylase RimI-like enzyme
VPGVGTYLFVALGAERILGHVSIHQQWEHTDLGIPGWWLTGLEVDPMWRGRGIGNRLIEQIIKSWEADNAEEPLYLVVKATNRPAVSLFERAGFGRHESSEWAQMLRKVYRETRNRRWVYQIMRRLPEGQGGGEAGH